ncbi:MAG: hypothetical protein EOO71_31070 [Myxococcaceae bacterium]|nr:MAG: hypothetical protein EOO71_31070 [Myxococcaceae bacterium]
MWMQWKAAAAVMGLMGLFAATGAQALELVAVTCATGTSVGSFTPGVTNTPRQVTSRGKGLFGPCLGTQPGIVYGEFSYTGTGSVSCLTNNSTGRFSVTWNDGTTSTVGSASIITVRPNVVISEVSGVITSGRFQGATIVHTVTLAQTDLSKCSGTGFTDVAGPGTLTVLGLTL